MEHVDAYPLQWPADRPRTPSFRRQRSAFGNFSYFRAAADLRDEVSRLGGRNIVISTDLKLRQDGLPYASQRKPDDPGAAVYFTYKDRQTCFACDRWEKLEDNLRAICKTIEALRGIARWGTGDMIDAAFQGFETLPPPASQRWFDVLEVQANSPRDVVLGAYRALRSRHHPDKGGDTVEFQRVQRAWDQYQQENNHA